MFATGDDEFGVPFFKVLSATDCGKSRSKQAALYIPVELRAWFPTLRSHSNGPSPSQVLEVLSHDRHRSFFALYEMQLRKKKRQPETRLSGKVVRLLSLFGAGDILVMQSSRLNELRYQVKVLQKGSPDHRKLMNLIGDRTSGAVPGYFEGALGEGRRLIARLDRIEPISKRGKYSFEFDCIDAELPGDDLGEAFRDPNVTRPFALVRVLASETQLASDLGSIATEGMWVEMQIADGENRSRLSAEVAQLTPAGYTEVTTGSLGEIRLLYGPDEPPKDYSPAGASVASSRAMAVKVKALCGISPKTPGISLKIAEKLRRRLAKAHAIVVHDVGQASFATICSFHGEQLAHFDAGWPISFNGFTAPALPPEVKSAPVILSHWDWDHLHAWHAVQKLRSSEWIVPLQPIGPGATKVANALFGKGLLMSHGGSNLPLGASTLISCTGNIGMNDTGLALELQLASGKKALLVGDASYDRFGTAAAGPFDFLIGTHHGAEFSGSVPLATVKGDRCVLSVGKDNIYGHPKASAVSKHQKAGWKVERTCSQGKIARGDRILG